MPPGGRNKRDLTGHAGGIEKKIGLLKLEQTDMSGMFVPKRDGAVVEVLDVHVYGFVF